ncbi:MAG: DUF2059 domain-containing protein [Gemmatimonadetes bacterium]|nr:DUF2059 domain-containing protein [Gemmatimonadota bacterium]
MRRITLSSTLALIILATPRVAPCQESSSPQPPSPTRELMDLMAGRDVAIGITDDVIAALAAKYPDVPSEDWDEFRVMVHGEEYAELTAAIWERHFTAEEIEGLLEFYRSPLGQKLVATKPLIEHDIWEDASGWSLRAAKIVAEIHARGYSSAPEE